MDFLIKTNFLVLALAIIFDYVLKEPPNSVHPVTLIGKYISFWSNINISFDETKCARVISFLFGMVMTVLGIGLCIVMIIFIVKFTEPYPAIYIILNVFLLKTAFSSVQLFRVAKEIYSTLISGNISEARQLTGFHLVSRDTSTLNETQVISAVIESLAENIVDSIISPLFYFMLGGLPLAWSYRFTNTADAMIGYHSERFEYLGKFAARLDDMLNFIPARISGILMVIAAALCRYNSFNALCKIFTEAPKTLSPNAGIPMSAVAGALEITLEKIGHYQLKGGDSLPSKIDIIKAIRLVSCAVIIWYVICLLITLFVYLRFS